MLRFLPVALCAGIASVQIFAAFTNPLLSPWKMGGFGMFSKINERKIVFTGKIRGEKSERVIQLNLEQLDPKFDTVNTVFLDRMRNFPKDSILEEALKALEEGVFLKETRKLSLMTHDYVLFRILEDRVIPLKKEERQRFLGKNLFERISVKVFDLKFNKRERTLSYELINEKSKRL